MAIDQVLRLLHPFVPFLTERLWEALNAQAPTRGIETPLPRSEFLLHAAWPTPHSAWSDASLEGHMTFLQDVIRAIRDIRSRYTIAPQVKIQVRIRATGEAAIRLQAWRDLLMTMAAVESVEIAPDVQRSPDAATAVVGAVELSIPGVVDVEKERARLSKQCDQLRGRIDGSRRKLANTNFLSKASPDVVQKERDRLAECEAEMAHVEAALTALG
jgi:valyl-tRNA synthetase